MEWTRYLSHIEFAREIANGVHPNEIRWYFTKLDGYSFYLNEEGKVDVVIQQRGILSTKRWESVDIQFVPKKILEGHKRIQDYKKESE